MTYSIIARPSDQCKHAEALAKHNVVITSAFVARPWWMFNELEKLIEEACLEANIELFAQPRQQSDVARRVSREDGKKHPLVIEQSSFHFRTHIENRSGPKNELAKTFITTRVGAAVLENRTDIGPDEVKPYAVHRLFVEFMRKRIFWHYERSTGLSPRRSRPTHDAGTRSKSTHDSESREERESSTSGDESGSNAQDALVDDVIIPDFWLNGSSFTTELRESHIKQAEEDFAIAVEDAVESLILKDMHEIGDYAEKQGLLADVPRDDWVARHKAIKELVRTMSPPAEIGSWWRPVDAILVIADFPEPTFIANGAMRALSANPDWDCKNSTVYTDYELVARGAALEASDYLKGWEDEQRWERCAETGEGCDELYGAEEDEYESALDEGHEEL